MSNSKMGKIEKFLGFTIKFNLTKITLNIYQSGMVSKMNQCFNNDGKHL